MDGIKLFGLQVLDLFKNVFLLLTHLHHANHQRNLRTDVTLSVAAQAVKNSSLSLDSNYILNFWI